MIHGINNCGFVAPETETMYCVTFLWIVLWLSALKLIAVV